jgi:hypothetical protein
MYVMLTQTKGTPHEKKGNCLGYNQNPVMSPGGAQRQDDLTD